MATAVKELAFPDVSLPLASRPARLWPAAALVVLYWIGRWTITAIVPGQFAHVLYLFWAPLWVMLLLLIWLVGFSRMTWADRGWVALCLFGTAIGAGLLADPSMRVGLYMYALPVAITALVGAMIFIPRLAIWPHRLALLTAALVGFGYYTLLRFDGVDGALQPALSWRWDPTAEQRFLAARAEQAESQTAPGPTSAKIDLPETASERDWPAFRGALRDGVVRGVSIQRDWQANPPREVWRRRVGPGWSSFAVVGSYAFTQEQRGEEEAVVCFEVESGREAWSYLDKLRFEETVAGAGPRATPTFEAGKIYSQGATGKLNCLEAATGKFIWTADIAADGKATPPQWGYSSSPLIAHGLVFAVPAGKDGKTLLAYDAEEGKLKWSAGKGTHSYSSPQLWNGGGVPQVLLVSDFGLQSFEPETGKVLWEHDWTNSGIFRVVQPLASDDVGILLGTGMGIGTRQLKVTPAGEGKWNVAVGWTSKDIKPYFNDFVRYGDHLFGFDNDLFTCIDLATGKRAWKKGRYGAGQVLLVEESGLLIAVSENSGELVLLEANPKQHFELGRVQVLSGKTWNHPVIVPAADDRGPLLLIRNGEEMACFELPAGT